MGIALYLLCLYIVYRHLDDSKYPQYRLYCLMVSLVTELGLLGIFKYCNFFVDSLQLAASQFGIEFGTMHLDIILPVGISFYTFQSLSYTTDIYRKHFKPTDRFPLPNPAMEIAPQRRGGVAQQSLGCRQCVFWTPQRRLDSRSEPVGSAMKLNPRKGYIPHFRNSSIPISPLLNKKSVNPNIS